MAQRIPNSNNISLLAYFNTFRSATNQLPLKLQRATSRKCLQFRFHTFTLGVTQLQFCFTPLLKPPVLLQHCFSAIAIKKATPIACQLLLDPTQSCWSPQRLAASSALTAEWRKNELRLSPNFLFLLRFGASWTLIPRCSCTAMNRCSPS